MKSSYLVKVFNLIGGVINIEEIISFKYNKKTYYLFAFNEFYSTFTIWHWNSKSISNNFKK